MPGIEQRNVLISLNKETLSSEVLLPDMTWLDSDDLEVALTDIVLPCTWHSAPKTEMSILVFPFDLKDLHTRDRPNRGSFFHVITLDNKPYRNSMEVIKEINTHKDVLVQWPHGQEDSHEIPLSGLFQISYDHNKGKVICKPGPKLLDQEQVGLVFTNGLTDLLGLSVLKPPVLINGYPTVVATDVYMPEVDGDLTRQMFVFLVTGGEDAPDILWQVPANEDVLKTLVDVNLEGVKYSYIDGTPRPWLATFDANEAKLTSEVPVITGPIIPPRFLAVNKSDSMLHSLRVNVTYSGTNIKVRPSLLSHNGPLRPRVQLTFQKSLKEWNH